MRSMKTFEGPLIAFRHVLEADRENMASSRLQRRENYDAATREVMTQLREQIGYKTGPMMNEFQIRRSFSRMMGTVVERQLLMLVSPMYHALQAFEQSLHQVSIYASPSGNGPERYAPKPRGTMPQQIKVGGCHE